MARLPEEVVERIRREISVERLAEARGIKLRRVGKNLMGRCPFHQDKHPSLSITPRVNKWHCLGCGKGGTAIDWVMCAEGVSTRHALELLSRDLVPMASPRAGLPPKTGTVRKLPPLIGSGNDDKKLLEVVVSYYHQTLKEQPEAQQYLLKRGLPSAEMIEHFRLGYSNRTLGYHLPASNRLAGAEQRGRLTALGIYRESGHEHLSGSVVIPILNLDGEVAQMYGRKITANLRAGTPDHLYLPGPLRGVWNEPALIASKEIILCEALMDALTFWCAGYRNVTSIYGVNNFTDDLRAALKRHGTKRIYIAYDRDQAGDRAAQAHGEELMSMGMECFRVEFPKGSVKDANEYARLTQPAAKALGLLLNSAAWLGQGKRPAVSVKGAAVDGPQEIEEVPAQSTVKEKILIAQEPGVQAEPACPEPGPGEIPPRPAEAAKEKISVPEAGEKVFPLAASASVPGAVQPVTPQAAAAETLPAAARMTNNANAAPAMSVERKGEEVVLTEGDRRYRVRGFEKAMSYEQLRVNLLVSSLTADGFHVDTIDLYKARDRVVFAKLAAEELRAKEETIKRDLQHALMKLEVLQHEQIKRALRGDEETQPEMTGEERAAALDLLRDPRLLDRVLEDFEKCGVVGEETNKRVSYLAAVSRLLEKPLAIVVQSASSAGKSSLMEAVLDFMPPEQREEYTAMTGQSLFYMGGKNLKHKILAIAEQRGADAAAYPLKLLQSEGKLNIASTGKDPATGKHVTHDYQVEGPVMIFLTTTAHEVDEELLNRCLVLTVNEEREQTRAIQKKQREARTIDGYLARRARDQIVRRHRNAQRLLRPLAVVNNHDLGEFPDTMTRTRRDHAKFLTLIEAVTLLYQHQREIKTISVEGEKLEYIEATAEDVKLAGELRDQVLKPSWHELPPQTRKLLAIIEQMAQRECDRLQLEPAEYRFSRRGLRGFAQWGDTQLRLHLRRLEEMEYVRSRHGGPGQTFLYWLSPDLEEPGVERRNHAGSRGARGGGAGPEAGELSPVGTRSCGESARGRGESIYKGQPENAKTSVVVASQPNGHAAIGRAEVK